MSAPMMKHARLSPSKRHRWTKDACPGSARVEAEYPNKSSPAAERGTLLHEIAAQLIENEIRTADDYLRTDASWALD